MTRMANGLYESSEKSTGFHVLILTLGYILLHGSLAYLVPRFEPATHNDDWVYVPPAKHFYETGEFQPHPIAAALALPQILIGGGIFNVAGSYRYGLLRDAMVVFGVLPIWLMWILARQLNFSRRQATWGALLLMVNPLVISLTWSFQTEIPFLTFALAGLVCLLASEKNSNKRWAIFPAFCALLLMSLTRQTGLCVVAAVVFYLLIETKWISAVLIGLVIPVTLLVEHHLTANAGLIYHPYAKFMLSARLSEISAKTIFLILYEGTHLIGFLGVFCLPLFLIEKPQPISRWALFSCGLLFAISFSLDSLTGLTPELGPYLHLQPSYSLGPRTLEVSSSPSVEITEGQGVGALIFRLVAAIGGTILLGHLISQSSSVFQSVGIGDRQFQDDSNERNSRSANSSSSILLVLALWATLAGVLLTSVVIGRRPFDQYLIVGLPLGFGLLLLRTEKRQPVDYLRGGLLLASVFAFGTMGIVGAIDYWRWNEARWQAIARLESQGMSYRQIDGGYAYNGMHSNLSLSPEILDFHRQRGSAIPKSWSENQHPPVGDVYIVGLSPPLATQELVFEIPYQTPLSRNPRRIYVKKVVDRKRNNKPSPSPIRPQSQVTRGDG